MHNWLMTPLGCYIRTWEEKCFHALTADIFGFQALQIGLPEIGALDESRIKNRWLTHFHCSDNISPNSQTQISSSLPISVVHNFYELPFASQSIDLVILPHVLEFAEYPHQILREVERILIPEGQVIVSGFNPASLWGLRQVFARMTSAHFLPEYAEFISLPRLKDWLNLLNLETNRGHFGCYLPPFKTTRWLNRYAFMEKTGGRWWPYLGAIYVVQAIKRIHGMHLIGPAVRKKQRTFFQGIPVNNRTIQKK